MRTNQQGEPILNWAIDLKTETPEFPTLAKALEYLGERDDLNQVEIDHDNYMIYPTFFQFPDE